ncbi:MAG: hypothetical protein IKC32_03690 [Clostridia bacterium]|nr:hypothetical protein [Clostridia bacterium]
MSNAVRLSKENISAYVGEVLPIELVGCEIDASSPITWGADGAVARVRSFSVEALDEEKTERLKAYGDATSPKNVALISVWDEGCGYVYAEYRGKRYEARISARPMLSADGELSYYRGDLHVHTSQNHKTETFPLHETEDIPDCLDTFIEDGGLDLTVLSDHAGVTNDRDFYRGFKLAEELSAPVVLAGAESEVMFVDPDRFGIGHRHSGEIVTLCSAGYTDSSSWEAFEEEMKYSGLPVAIFAHPHVVGFSTKGIWNFDFKNRATEQMLHTVRGIEMGSGTPFKENILHEYAISQALDAGFKLSTTCSGDCHGPNWGFGFCPGKTVVIAKEKSREAFHEALRACRFYATESGNVKLRYSVNGCTAPAELALTESYRFKLELDLFTPDPSTMPTYLEVISDYGRVAYSTEISGGVTEFELCSDSARYFYLRLIDEEGRKTWSMPVWCGRKFDEAADEPMLTPVDMTGFTATADGKDALELIDGDPLNSFTSDRRTPRIVIDMKASRRISAIGYYPHQIYRSLDKGPGWLTADETPSLLSKYNIYLSADGESYSLVKQVNCRILGEENIERFAPTEARYIMLEVTETVGMNSRRKEHIDKCARIGNISVFE